MSLVNKEQIAEGLGKRLLSLYTQPSSSLSDMNEANASISGLLYNIERLDQADRKKFLLLLGSGYAIDMKEDSFERHILEKLVQLLGDPKSLSDWLSLYTPKLLQSFLQVYKTPQLVKANLDTFTPSAITFLMENIGFVGLANVVNKSAESSVMNDLFAADKLRFSNLRGNGEANREYELFKTALNGLGSFQTEAAFYVKQRMLHMHASLEGDVATSCVINVILPVASVMNELLVNSYKMRKIPPGERSFLGIRAELQLTLGAITSRVDHALVLNPPSSDISYTKRFKSGEGKPLVLFEEKIIGCMEEDWNFIRQWQLNKENPIVKQRLAEMYKMMPQIRKLVNQPLVMKTKRLDPLIRT